LDYPGREAFVKLSKKGNLIPVYREILADMDTPVSAFLKVSGKPSFLLESVEGGEKWARYSFLGFEPSRTIKGIGREVEISGPDGTDLMDVEDPIALLREIMQEYRPVEVEGLPEFWGGLVGYLGYDMVRFIEELPQENTEGLGLPDMFLMHTDLMLIFDNLRQTIKVVCNVHLNDSEDPGKAYDQAVKRIDGVIERLKKPAKEYAGAIGAATSVKGHGSGGFHSSFGPQKDFEAAVERAKEYIYAGDVVQVVLSQRFQRKSEVNPFNVYRALRVINPSPYMYYLDTGDAEIVGSSPEILVKLEDRKVTVRPIAGTRQRGATDEEDEELAQELLNDPKERAEHIMLVDLGRNDVGRVAEIGSVSMTDLMVIERYSHVMHMVSNVEGTLKEGLDAVDVFKACFPAGTVSGAPKIRAMEIIEELEPVLRGPYAGSVGYIGYSGSLNTCITIRTLVIKDGIIYLQAGAGIVADSVPETEYQETVNKAMGMMRAVDMAEAELE
jgi:anthranilate synthase component 1